MMTDKRAIPTNRYAIQLAFFVAFGGVISGCLIMPDFVRRFGQVDGNGNFFLSSSRQSIITSLLSAGTFVGALAQAFTSDRFGRRRSILIWSAIFTIGVAIQTGTEFSVVQLTIGRFVAGLGVGALSCIVPLYNAETAPKALRGTLLVLYQLQIIIGIFISYVLDLATHSVPGSASWRVPVGLQLLWGLILLSGIFFLPESPRHLLGLGRDAEARTALAALNGVPEDDALVDELVGELDYAIKAENEGGRATWAECFSSRNYLWKRTANGMMLQFIQQLNGQNFYYYYGDTFFQSAGTALSPYAIQTILGAVSVVGTIPALRIIETWGRRRSLLTGAILQAICALIAGVVGHTTLASAGARKDQLTARNRQGGDVLIAFAVLHLFCYSLFWGPTPWVYLGESFPLRVRAKSISLGSATNWIWNFLLSFFSPRISARIGPLIMLIFFGMLVFGFFYVYFCIPETKGLTLEEVDEMYRSGVKPWNSSSWKPRLSEEAHEKMHKKHDLKDQGQEKEN
ncbi:sugar transporter [Agrocybe pediades]|nr:sugar transporter [Agrocybe pediades]